MSAESPLVGGSRFAASDVGAQIRIFVENARRFEPEQHRHHHQVARAKRAIEPVGIVQATRKLTKPIADAVLHLAVAEVSKRLGHLESVVTKTSLGFHSAQTITPALACERIYQSVLQAIAHRDQRHPYVLAPPITLDVSFKNYQPAEILSYLHTVTRTDSHSIRFVGQNMKEVSDFVDFLDYYNPDAAP